MVFSFLVMLFMLVLWFLFGLIGVVVLLIVVEFGRGCYVVCEIWWLMCMVLWLVVVSGLLGMVVVGLGCDVMVVIG